MTNLSATISRNWNDSIVPQLVEYIRIPAKSPHFDPQWEAHGHIERVIRLAEAWVRRQPGETNVIVPLPPAMNKAGAAGPMSDQKREARIAPSLLVCVNRR